MIIFNQIRSNERKGDPNVKKWLTLTFGISFKTYINADVYDYGYLYSMDNFLLGQEELEKFPKMENISIIFNEKHKSDNLKKNEWQFWDFCKIILNFNFL